MSFLSTITDVATKLTGGEVFKVVKAVGPLLPVVGGVIGAASGLLSGGTPTQKKNTGISGAGIPSPNFSNPVNTQQPIDLSKYVTLPPVNVATDPSVGKTASNTVLYAVLGGLALILVFFGLKKK